MARPIPGPMLILVDQDNVLADFDAGFLAAWRAAHPSAPFVPPAARRAWNPRDDLPAEFREAAMRVYASRHFFRDLPAIPGGREALEQMLGFGWNVRICTAPIERYEHCVSEKFAWVERHLGPEWCRRIVLTADKTVVHGDWLIDDKVDIVGSRAPSWRHALFDANHNRHVAHPHRLDWRQWRDVLVPPGAH
jgi:5'-nucleotidase